MTKSDFLTLKVLEFLSAGQRSTRDEIRKAVGERCFSELMHLYVIEAVCKRRVPRHDYQITDVGRDLLARMLGG